MWSFVTGFFNLAYDCCGSSMFYHVVHSFFCLNNIPLHVYSTILFIHLLANEHLGCFQILAILNNAFIDIHVSLAFFIWLYPSHLSRPISNDSSSVKSSLVFHEVTHLSPTFLSIMHFLISTFPGFLTFLSPCSTVNFPKAWTASHHFSYLPWCPV